MFGRLFSVLLQNQTRAGLRAFFVVDVSMESSRLAVSGEHGFHSPDLAAKVKHVA